MRLRVFLPSEVLIDTAASKVVAEALNGSFGVLPRHIDFVAALGPGILAYVDPNSCERYIAIDQGTLVKRGDEVRVSTRNAVPGEDLGSLRNLVEKKFRELDEHERSARSALARLEAGVIRRFIELEEQT